MEKGGESINSVFAAYYMDTKVWSKLQKVMSMAHSAHIQKDVLVLKYSNTPASYSSGMIH